MAFDCGKKRPDKDAQCVMTDYGWKILFVYIQHQMGQVQKWCQYLLL